MEDKNKIMRSMLLSPGNKCILLTSSIFSSETFLKKLSSFSKAEKSNKQKFQKMTILTYLIEGYSPSIFFIIKKLDYFLGIFDKNHLNRNYLKEFSITLFSKNFNIDDYSYLFKELIVLNSINENFIFNSNKKIIFLNSAEISERHIEIYFTKKLRIFNIVKKKQKIRRNNLTKKTIIMKINSNNKEKELLFENSVKINSLIHISKEVKKFIEMKQQTTYNEVTKYILNLLKGRLNNNENEYSINFKNIQRRVYDAINVMTSLKIIRKNNMILTYHKYNEFKLKEEIENKRNILISKFIQLQCYKNLIEKNKNNFSRSYSIDKIELPFNLLISNSKDEEISIRTNTEKNKLIAKYNNAKFITFSQISKELIFNEFNESNNNSNFNNNNYYNNNETLWECQNYIQKNKLYEKYFSDFTNSKEKNKEFKKENMHLFETDFSNYINNVTLNSTIIKNEDNETYYELNDNNFPILNCSDKNTVFL